MATASAGLFGAAACGPSFQAIYEGNARFEHCYALEENAQTPMGEKADCWRDWSERYTYGQTRDRIHYATARYVALSAVEAPTDEALMMAAPGMTPRQTVITAPAPTNAFAPPPKVLDEADSGPPVRPTERRTVVGRDPANEGYPDKVNKPSNEPNAMQSPLPTLPSSECGNKCAKTFEACETKATCGDAGKNAACAACERTYRGCMRGCFK